LFITAVVFVALLTGLSTALSGGRWILFSLLSSVAAFLGILSGGMMWPSEDGIAQSYLLWGAMTATVVVATASCIAGLAVRFLFRFSGE
jgi:hypothetical protein